MKESKFTGSLFGLIVINLFCTIVSVISLGILIPWVVCLKESWYAERTIIDGKRLCFDGTGLQLFGNYIKWFLLTIITFGIYSFWLHIKLKQWVVKHTHFDKE